MHVVQDTVREDTEFRLLLDGVRQCFGFDFRDYDARVLRSRIWERVHAEQLQTISGYQEKVLHEPASLERLLASLTGNRTAMFADPGFYHALRATVVPLLRTYPSVQIWVPACSSGEEAYALAILLNEEGLYPKCRLYATDISEGLLRDARDGAFELSDMPEHAANYLQAGGTGRFSDYYMVHHDRAFMSPSLKEHLVFAEHHLATDGAFNEFQVIVCRNAMTCFNEWLQERVHQVFLQSLSRFGILALGPNESPGMPSVKEFYEKLESDANLYRKVK